MTEATLLLPPLIIVALALLGLPVFVLGLCVSLERGRTRQFSGLPADPDARLVKLVRAHGNATEYVPAQMAMIVAIGLREVTLLATVIIMLTVCTRYIQAAGILFGGSFRETNAIRFVGSLGTYLSGFALIAFLIASAF